MECTHSATDANGVNSGKPLTGNAEGNPEPSFDGNVIEGVTTNGRAYRRWAGHCAYCADWISKPLSSVHSERVFCNKVCKAKWQWQHKPPIGSNSDTSAPPVKG